MNYFMRALQTITRILVPIGIGALLIMMTVVTCSVIGRALFGAPIFGSVEVVELTSVILVSMIIGYTQLQKNNITVNVLVDRFSPRARAIVDLIMTILGAVVVIGLLWGALVYTQETAMWGETTNVFRITTTPFRAIWVFGLLTLLVILIGQIIKRGDKEVEK